MLLWFFYCRTFKTFSTKLKKKSTRTQLDGDSDCELADLSGVSSQRNARNVTK